MSTLSETTLWTIQTQPVWEHAVSRGVLKTDGRRIDEYFRPPYRWLIDQMRSRIPSYRDGYPVWAYPESKPDLRSPQFSRGVQGVRVEFVANTEDILLSDMGVWDYALSGHYFGCSEAEVVEFEGDNPFYSVWRNSESDPDRTARIMKSWEAMFELDMLRKLATSNPEWHSTPFLQATLGKVTLDQVTKVTPFTSR